MPVRQAIPSRPVRPEIAGSKNQPVARREPVRRDRLRCTPLCDHLEPRQLLAAVSWDGGGGDNLWSNALNWSNDTIPGPDDDVTIDVADTPTIRFTAAAGNLSLNSLTLRETLQVEGGSLTTAAAGGLVDTGGLVRIQGGTISGTWTSLLTPITATSFGGTLSNASINGEVVLNTTGALVTLGGTTTFTALRLSVGSTRVDIQAGYTLSNPIVAEGTASGNRTVLVALNASGNATIGASGSITASAGLGGNLRIIDNFTGTLINNGTITMNATGRTLSFNTDGLANNGTITLGSGAALDLEGQLITAGGIGTFNTAAGTVNIRGTINNTGGTLALTNETGSWELDFGGRIEGGRVTQSGASRLIPKGGTLAGVEVAGDIRMDTSNDSVRLEGATTFNALRVAGADAIVTILEGYTLNNPIIFDTIGPVGRPTVSAGTMTIGPTGSIVMTGTTSGELTVSAQQLINNGSIVMNGMGESRLSISATQLTNAGVINAAAGMTFDLGGTSGKYTNTGTIAIGRGVTLNLRGELIATGGIGTFNTAAGTVNVIGKITNTGNTIALTNATGPWRLAGGTITGGSLTQTPGNTLVTTDAGGILTSVAIAGELLLNTTGALLVISGSTSFATLRMSAGNTLVDLAAGYTLAGSIIVEGSELGSRIVRIGSVTIAPTGSIVARQGLASELSIFYAGSGSLINNGLISIEAAGRTLHIMVPTLTNNGVISAADAVAALDVSVTTLSNSGTILTRAVRTTISASTYTNNPAGTLNGGTWRFRSTILVLSNFPTVSTLGAIVEFNATSVPPSFSGIRTIATNGSYTVTGGTDQTIVPGGVTLTNRGTLEIGPGSRITLAGNYVQTSSGTYRVQLAGGNLDTDYGILAVTGAATVAGRFDAVAVNGYVPAGGQIQDVLTAVNGRTGTFTSVNFPSVVNPEWRSAFVYTAQGVRLIHTSIIDFDLSGEVDLTDYFQFFNWFDATTINADLDNSGEVDLNDFFLFLNLWAHE